MKFLPKTGNIHFSIEKQRVFHYNETDIKRMKMSDDKRGESTKMQNFNSIFEKLDCGKIAAKAGVVFAGGEKVLPDYTYELNSDKKTMYVRVEHENTFRDTLVFDYNGDKILARRVFENISDKEIRIKELAFWISGIGFDKDKDDDYFYHIENSRVFGNNTFPIDYDRFNHEAEGNKKFGIVPGDTWPDMGKNSEPIEARIGSTYFQPFPAILISNYQTKKGLVHGTLSQDVCYHNYDVSHDDSGVCLDIYSSFMDIDALTMEPGRVIIDEWYLGFTDEADDIERIFVKYSDELRKKLPIMYGRSNANRKYVAWGSWNDGLWRHISEDVILEEARYLKDNFPTAAWVQMDDGYAINNWCHSLGMPYADEEEVDHEKFPKGIRHYSDELRKIGIRPALWMGGKVPKEAKVVQEHPEWFLDYAHVLKTGLPFDVSREDVREYMLSAIKKLFLEYGFDSMKMDFWSHPFEDCHALLSDTHHSGYEYRRWWLEAIREVLPRDGYLQTGCDIAMGNPFLGEFATNYRYGVDIGHGNWPTVKLTILWGVNCFATHTGDMFVPNSDSIGLFPGLGENEAMFCINFCLVTHSVVEIAGQLSKSDNKERLHTLKKAICNPNNGQDVYLVNYDYRAKETRPMPDAMYFKTPHFSVEEGNASMPVVTVGLFNVDDEARTVSVKASDMGLGDGKFTFTNVWTGEQFKNVDSVSVDLDCRASALFAVSREEGIQLYDANIRVNALCADEKSMTIETDYAQKECELKISRLPKKMFFDGETVDFRAEGDMVYFDLPGKGTLTLEF